MRAKKLGSHQDDSVQEKAEGPKVLAVHSYGRGFLTGSRREAFIRSSGFKTTHCVISSLPRDVIVEEGGDELS